MAVQSEEPVKYLRFRSDMKIAGMKVIEYDGRNFYHGPAVVCDSLQKALSATKVPCSYDNMGLGWVVYPK